MTPEDILNNDLLLWERYTHRQIDEASGRVRAFLAEGIMPDGKRCDGLLPAGDTKEQLRAWVEFVRREYNAREQRQEAEARERADTARSSSQREAPAAELNGGMGAKEAEAPESVEAGLEAFLQSEITRLAGQLNAFEEQIKECEARAASLRVRRETALNAQRVVIRALKSVKQEQEELRAQAVREQNSKKPSDNKKGSRSGDREPVVVAQVQAPKSGGSSAGAS